MEDMSLNLEQARETVLDLINNEEDEENKEDEEVEEYTDDDFEEFEEFDLSEEETKKDWKTEIQIQQFFTYDPVNKTRKKWFSNFNSNVK